jgi:hypothetical protein
MAGAMRLRWPEVCLALGAVLLLVVAALLYSPLE